MTDDEVNGYAGAVVELCREIPGGVSSAELLSILFGAVLIVSREAGVQDFRLHQTFGAFLEDNADEA